VILTWVVIVMFVHHAKKDCATNANTYLDIYKHKPTS